MTMSRVGPILRLTDVNLFLFFHLAEERVEIMYSFAPAMLMRQELRDPDCWVRAIDG